jgi:hypothetical protein
MRNDRKASHAITVDFCSDRADKVCGSHAASQYIQLLRVKAGVFVRVCSVPLQCDLQLEIACLLNNMRLMVSVIDWEVVVNGELVVVINLLNLLRRSRF